LGSQFIGSNSPFISFLVFSAGVFCLLPPASYFFHISYCSGVFLDRTWGPGPRFFINLLSKARRRWSSPRPRDAYGGGLPALSPAFLIKFGSFPVFRLYWKEIRGVVLQNLLATRTVLSLFIRRVRFQFSPPPRMATPGL